MTKKKTTTKRPAKKKPVPIEVVPDAVPKKKQSEQSENQSKQSG